MCVCVCVCGCVRGSGRQGVVGPCVYKKYIYIDLLLVVFHSWGWVGLLALCFSVFPLAAWFRTRSGYRLRPQLLADMGSEYSALAVSHCLVFRRTPFHSHFSQWGSRPFPNRWISLGWAIPWPLQLLRAAPGCSGLLWAGLGRSGLFWVALACFGLLWAALGCSGLLSAAPS